MQKKHRGALSAALVCTLLTVFVCLACLSACTPAPDEPVPTATPTPTGIVGVETVKVSTALPYTILRSDLSGNNVGKAASALYKALEDCFTELNIDTDWTKDESGEAYEILIGDTNRPAGAAAREKALAAAADAENWFYIGIEGTKIVFLGSDEANLIGGVWCYITRYASIANQGGESIVVPESYCCTYEKAAVLVTETAGDYAGESFVAAAVVTEAPYFADSTGKLDVTAILQNAIDDVGNLGGGTVYLPAGTYLVSGTLTLPSHVCLRGAYADPDTGSISRGTVLSVATKTDFKSKNVVSLAASSCVQGIAFWYQGQNLQKPLEYAATIGCSGNCWTVKDCTFVNSWQGINTGTVAHGMSTLDGVKGTVLYRGYENVQTSDICVCQDVTFSPRYWANAGEAYNAPAEDAIRALMKEKKSVGFWLRDNDRDTYENITLDGFYTGIYSDVMTRAGTSGSFYTLTITGAVRGMDMHGVDARYGLLVANGRIEGSEFAVSNDTDGETCTATGKQSFVNLLASALTGTKTGGVRTIGDATAAEIAYTPYENDIRITAGTFYDMTGKLDSTGKTDISAALQAVLDEAKNAGGAVVYLPAGKYRLENPVTVGAGTVLTGCAPFTQGTSGDLRGTVLLVTYGKNGAADATAAVSVSGNGAGVQGMTVIYPDNGVSLDAEGNASQPAEYAYFLRMSGQKTFARFLTFADVSRAVCCEKCTDFVVDRILMCCYDEGIRLTDCSRGLLTRIHTNGTYHTGIGTQASKAFSADWLGEGSKVYTLIDQVICTRMTLLTVDDCLGIQATHVFHYGAKRYLTLKDSDIVIINGESGHQDECTLFSTGSQSELKIVNFIRLHAGGEPGKCVTGMNDATVLYNFDCAHTNVFNYKVKS